jgi:hypothetical protein
MRLVQDAIVAEAREQINVWRDSNPGIQPDQSILNPDTMTLTSLANKPVGVRGTVAPSESDMAAFCNFYSQHMTGLLGKTEAVIKNHIAIFTARLNTIKTAPDMLEKFKDFLTVLTSSFTPAELEEYAGTIEFLFGRIERYTKVKPPTYSLSEV